MGDPSPSSSSEEPGDGAGGGSGSTGSTTAGAALLMASPWLTAAAVTAYTTTAMWAKLREMGIFKSLRGRKAAAATAAATATGTVITAAEAASLDLLQDGVASNGLLLQDLELLQQREEGLGPDRPLEKSPIDY